MTTRGEQLTEERVREIVREEIERAMRSTGRRIMQSISSHYFSGYDARLERADIDRRTIPRPEESR